MNKSKYIAIALGITTLLGSACNKESLLTYIADNNIYFNCIMGANPATFTLGYYSDSTDVTFSFADDSVQDTLIGVPVGVTGAPANTDRNFKLVVDLSSTAIASTHYTLPPAFVIRAGQLRDTVWIRFNRTSDLKTKQISLLLQLQENDQFKTQLKFRPRMVNSQTDITSQDTIKTLSFKVNLNDMLSAGPYWDREYIYYFGTFSQKKVRLMNEVAGMPLTLWSKSISNGKERADVVYYGGFVARYLADEAAAGNTILDEDGFPMTMGDMFR